MPDKVYALKDADFDVSARVSPADDDTPAYVTIADPDRDAFITMRADDFARMAAAVARALG